MLRAQVRQRPVFFDFFIALANVKVLNMRENQTFKTY